MSVILSNYSMMLSGVNLTNSSDVVANSYSVIQGNKIVNLLDLIKTSGETTDTYTKTQLDHILNKFLNYDTIDASTIKLKLNSNTADMLIQHVRQ